MSGTGAVTPFKRPESVLVIIHTCGGDVLLLERSQPRGYWQSVTGSLHEGESAGEAAVREVREETGLDVRSLLRDEHHTNHFRIVPEWRHRYAPDVSHNLEHVFSARLDDRAEVRLNPAEHTGFVWLPRAAAAGRTSSSTNRDAILAVVPEPAGTPA